MELIEVEAVEDRTRPQGGHAVILLRGVKPGVVPLEPSGARFRLHPLQDLGLSAQAQAFLDTAHEPLAVRATADGVALDIGPELADAPFLVPGMALEITLPAAGLRGELIWPVVTPLARPKRRNIMTRRVPGETPSVPLATQPADIATPPTPLSPQLKPAHQPDPETPKSNQSPLPVEPIAPQRRPVVLTSDRLRESPRPLPETIAPSEPSFEQPPVQKQAVVVPAHAPVPVQAPADEPPISPPAAPVVQPLSLPTSPIHQRPVAQVDKPETLTPVALEPIRSAASRWNPATTAVAAIAILLASQLVGMRLFDLRLSKRTAELPTATKAGIYDVLAAGPVSPRGVTAEGVSPARALQLAHLHQHGPEADRDRDEAIYWLKRYVLATSGSEHSRIALTQLGTAYARPGVGKEADGKRDIARAVVAWELAGALGDTVAMCFLAALHEQGVGMPIDKTAAELWQSRAAKGNCAATSPAVTSPR